MSAQTYTVGTVEHEEWQGSDDTMRTTRMTLNPDPGGPVFMYGKAKFKKVQPGDELYGEVTENKGKLKFKRHKRDSEPRPAGQVVREAAQQAFDHSNIPDERERRIVRQSSFKASLEACKIRWPNGIPEGINLKDELRNWAAWFDGQVFGLEEAPRKEPAKEPEKAVHSWASDDEDIPF